MFMIAVFIINKNWKQHKCPSTGEWINKLGYMHTIRYYSATNGNRLLNRHQNMEEARLKMYDTTYMIFWKRSK